MRLATNAGHLYTAPAGAYGFDCNTPVSPRQAKMFAARGYRFAMRYVARVMPHAGDLSADEAQGILDSGMGVSIVQHVQSDKSWTPTHEKGIGYGRTATQIVDGIGLPYGTEVWCDLEGVARGVSPLQVADYLNAWHLCVAGAGYSPGLYVGWHCGLNSAQLYRDLRFTRYWGAYNTNADELPAVRGICMKQQACGVKDRVAGCSIEFDINRVQADNLGGLPTIFAAEGWGAPGVLAA